MKDTIDSKDVTNRKIITEIRYLPNPIISDKISRILRSIEKKKLINPAYWEYRLAEAEVNDNENKQESRTTLFFSLNKITFIASNISTNSDYSSRFFNIYREFKEVVGHENIDITRIGCRIQATYNCKYKTYNEILERFKEAFPNKLFFDGFDFNDLLLRIVYENGMYQVGPINNDDSFYLKHFKHEDSVNTIGFGLDTDNYVSKGKDDMEYIKDSLIKSVIKTSLSVEKYLFDELNSL